MMRTTDDLGMPVFCDIQRLCCELGTGPVDSEPYHSPDQCFCPCGHFAGYRCPDVTPLILCLNFLSSLLMPLVVHPLSGNSVLNCLALYPYNWLKFFI